MSGLYLLRIVALCLACVFFHTTCRFLSRNVVVKWKKHTDNSCHPCAFTCVCASPAFPLLTLQAIYRVLVRRMPVLVGDGQQRYATDDQQGHREDPPIAGDAVGEAL